MSKPEYIKKILSILLNTKDEWIIKQIYRCAVNITKGEKGGET